MQEELKEYYEESIFLGYYIDQVWPLKIDLRQLKTIKDLVFIYAYVELFTDKDFKWQFHVRVKNSPMKWSIEHAMHGFQDFYTTVWKVFKVTCPICGSPIYRLNKREKKAQCKKGHLINYYDLLIQRSKKRSSKPSLFTK